MSAPLSPEQRAVVKKLADYAGALTADAYVTAYGYQRADLVATALRAALAERTCGTCLHDKCCGIQAACVSSRFTDKRVTGCIGAWEARPSQTETTP